jgi:hypothetical protein
MIGNWKIVDDDEIMKEGQNWLGMKCFENFQMCERYRTKFTQ